MKSPNQNIELTEGSNEGEETQPIIAEAHYGTRITGKEDVSLASEDNDLININKVIRWLYRFHLDEQIFLTSAISILQRKRLFLSGPSIPIESAKTRSWISYTTAFYQGLRGYTNVVWPAVFWSMLLADTVQLYQFPDSRYGNRLDKILGGTSSSQLMLTSMFGIDIPAERGYWMPTVAITLFAPVLMGIINSARHYNRHRYDDALKDDIKKETFWQSLSHLVPGLPHNKLNQAEFNLLWNKQLTTEQRCQLSEAIITVANSTSILASWHAQQILANFTDSFHTQDMERLGGIDIKHFELLQANALVALNNISKLSNTRNYIDWILTEKFNVIKPGLKSLFANDLLWMLGHYDHPLKIQLMQVKLISVGLALYPTVQLAKIWWQKISKAIDFAQAEKTCLAENRLWSYVAEIADYDCLACEGPHVSLQAKYTAQGCLDALLSSNHSATAITQQMVPLLRQVGITNINLLEDWPRWLSSELDKFLTTFDQANITSLKSVNISRAIINPLPPAPGHIKRLAEFLQIRDVQVLDLKRVGLGADNMKRLMPAIVQANIEILDLTENALGDEGIVNVALGLPGSGIKTLIVRTNQMGTEGLKTLAAKMFNATITRLDISDNRFGEEGVVSLSQAINATALVEIVLSDNPLSINAIKALSASRAIHTYDLDNTGINDQKIKFLSANIRQHNVTQILILSNNRITSQGIRILFNDLRNMTLLSIDLAHNNIADSGLVVMSKIMPEMNLSALDISDCHFSEQAFKQFLMGLGNSTLMSLRGANNRFTDGIIPAMISSLSNANYPVKQWDFSDNRLTSHGVLQLGPALININATQLVLRNNLLDARAGSALASLAASRTLQVMDVSNNQLNEMAGLQIAAALPTGYLQKLILDNNPLGDKVGLALANILIKPLPNQAHYLQQPSRDEWRALKRAQPNTQLKELGLINTQIGNNAARGLCLFQPHTNISFLNLHLNNNPIKRELVDIRTCEMSSSQFNNKNSNSVKANAPSATASFLPVALVYGLPLLIIFYLLYRLARPLFEQTNRYRLFSRFTFLNKTTISDNKTSSLAISPH